MFGCIPENTIENIFYTTFSHFSHLLNTYIIKNEKILEEKIEIKGPAMAEPGNHWPLAAVVGHQRLNKLVENGG